MAPSKHVHHDAQSIEGQVAGGEVAGPPGHEAHKQQVVDTGEGRRQGDPWKAEEKAEI